jgi:putative salt-induced outer membrane protein
LRQTNFIPAGPKNTLASRAAVNYAWSVIPNLKLTENVSYYNEDKDGTFTANTALTVGLIGSLSVQASYLAQYESTPATALLHRYNSTARTTLVYSF